MKAANRKLKLKSRAFAGRNQIEDAIRTPSGAISRSSREIKRRKLESETHAMQTATEARQRRYGIEKAENARDPLLGFSLGRLHKAKRISKAQFDAGQLYSAQEWLYLATYMGTAPTVRAQNLFAVKGYSGDDMKGLSPTAKAATNSVQTIKGAFLSMSGDITANRQVQKATYEVCVLDQDCDNWPDHMINILRKGLNVLVSHYAT